MRLSIRNVSRNEKAQVLAEIYNSPGTGAEGHAEHHAGFTEPQWADAVTNQGSFEQNERVWRRRQPRRKLTLDPIAEIRQITSVQSFFATLEN